VANHSGSSRDIPASCSRQSLGRTEPLSRNLTAAKRSRNRFSAEGIGSVVGIYDCQPADSPYRKERPELRRISPQGLSLSGGKRSRCCENSMGRKAGRAEDASLISTTGRACADPWAWFLSRTKDLRRDATRHCPPVAVPWVLWRNERSRIPKVLPSEIGRTGASRSN
jgi:hypothetical protein